MTSTRYVWFAFGIGAALGGAAALIFAPQTGATTRKQLGDAFDEAVDQASDYAEDAGVYLKDQADKLTTEAQKTVKAATDAATELASAAIDKTTTQTKKVASMF